MKTRQPFLRRKLVAWTTLFATLAISGLSFALPEPAPDPTRPDPEMIVVDTATIDATKAQGHIVKDLPAGQYEIFASGGYAYFQSWERDQNTGEVIPDKPPQLQLWADAECSQMMVNTTRVWSRRQPFQSINPADDYFDLYVDNKNVEWNLVGGVSGQENVPNSECDQNDGAVQPNASDPTKHVLRTYWISLNWRGGDLSLRVLDGDYKDNLGAFKIVIKAPRDRVNEELVSALTVPSASPNGVFTPELISGQRYRFVVSGTYQNGSFDYRPDPNMNADAECWTRTGDTGWNNARIPEDADYQSDLLDLVGEDGVLHSEMDGNLDWVPLSGTGVPGDCATDAGRNYQYAWVARDPQFYPAPRNTTRVNFKINDYHYADNFGALTLRIYKVEVLPAFAVRPDDPEGTTGEVSGAAGQAASPVTRTGPQTSEPDPATRGCATYEDNTCVETMTVPLYGSVKTAGSVPPGNYVLEVRGAFNYYKNFQADAECTTGTAPGVQDPVPWQRNRYSAYASPGSDVLDVYVAGMPVEWAPKGLTNELDCHSGADPASHVYNHELAWEGGQLEFYIYDPVFQVDENGDPAHTGDGLTLNIYKAGQSEGLVAVVVVNSSDPSGSTSPLLSKDVTYVFEVTGKYNYYGYGGSDFEADAECSRKGNTVNYTPTQPNYSNDPGWNSQRFSLHHPGQDPLDLYIGDAVSGGVFGGGSIAWTPSVPLSSGLTPGECADGNADANHTYTTTFTPPADGAVRFRIHEQDPYFYTDNSGFLTVRIFQIQ